MSIVTRLTRLELHASPKRKHLTLFTCDDVTFWSADADGVPDYRLCVHGLDDAGNCVPPVGATSLTRDDVDALGVRFTVMVVQWAKL